MTVLGRSDLDVVPLCLGGNVFDWTADRDTSFAILDAFLEGGGDFVDTAESYSHWVPGHVGGESETVIGEWLASRRPARMIVATKVKGLSATRVRESAEASLRRLGVETIDLFYAHHPDPDVPLDETVGAFADLVQDGLVRWVGVSNHGVDVVRRWIELAGDSGAAPVALQPQYNLLHRAEVEEGFAPLAAEAGLGILPYYGLAHGFLTGKYRSAEDAALPTPRAKSAARYATPEGLAVVDALEAIAAAHGASIAATALAWLRSRPAVVAPIASASRPEQVPDLLASTRIALTPAEIGELDRVSAAAQH